MPFPTVFFPTRFPCAEHNLSVVGHGEGTLNVARQVFEPPYEESDAKQLLQKGRGEPSLQLLIGVQVIGIQGAGGFEESAQRKTDTDKHSHDIRATIKTLKEVAPGMT